MARSRQAGAAAPSWSSAQALAVGAFDGAIGGAALDQVGWFLHDNVGWFRWNTMGALWAVIGALLGAVVAGWLLHRGALPPLSVRRYVARLSWLRIAALAAAVRAVVDVDMVELVASVTLAVAMTVGYFVEANALFRLAVDRFRLFATLVGALLGAVAGAVANSPAWLVGGWAWAAGGAVVGALVGSFVWGTHPPEQGRRLRIPEQAAPAIFLAPALLFVGIALLIPTLRTIYLSFFGDDSIESVGLDNYRALRDDSGIVNFGGWGDLAGSRLFFLAAAVLLVLLVAAVARAVAVRLRTDFATPGKAAALLVGAGAVLFGVLYLWPMRRLVDIWLGGGTLDDTVLALLLSAAGTAVGLLAIAAGLSVQRSMDFTAPLPTFSLTTAAALVLLAAVSAFSGVLWNNIFWIVLVTGFATLLGLAIAVLADQARGESLAKSLIFMPMAISFVGASIIWRFIYAEDNDFGLLNATVVNLGGEPQLWVQERPWNTLFLIAIMIWIQTGFAMVILSAAIKGVPEELREAARIDGASEMDTFWRVTLPHIRATVVVVITTLIVTVLKVYDLVQVMTGGRFGTNVIANQMFDEVFRFRDFGRGSALATLLFLGVVPLMIMNVRRVRRQEELR